MTKRCSVCILPDSLPGLTFDQQGKCNYCKDPEDMHIKEQALPCTFELKVKDI